MGAWLPSYSNRLGRVHAYLKPDILTAQQGDFARILDATRPLHGLWRE